VNSPTLVWNHHTISVLKSLHPSGILNGERNGRLLKHEGLSGQMGGIPFDDSFQMMMGAPCFISNSSFKIKYSD